MKPEEGKRATVSADVNFFTGGLWSGLSTLVQKTWAEPLLLTARLVGEKAETLLEPGARLAGKWIGQLSKPAFAASRVSGEHALEDALKATRLAENLTGIFGKDYYIDEKKIVRQIHTCPFKDRPGAKILCHLGEAAGQEWFETLIPGARHKVHVTMARGHAFCEYSYERD